MIKDDMKPIDIVKYSKLSEEKIKELYLKHSGLSKKQIEGFVRHDLRMSCCYSKVLLQNKVVL
jgi:hypothetical protein